MQGSREVEKIKKHQRWKPEYEGDYDEMLQRKKLNRPKRGNEEDEEEDEKEIH